MSQPHGAAQLCYHLLRLLQEPLAADLRNTIIKYTVRKSNVKFNLKCTSFQILINSLQFSTGNFLLILKLFVNKYMLPNIVIINFTIL